jgi:hypothetical protein
MTTRNFSCCEFFRDGIPEFFAVHSEALGFHRIIYSKKLFIKFLAKLELSENKDFVNLTIRF